jgi:hypothetical protein
MGLAVVEVEVVAMRRQLVVAAMAGFMEVVEVEVVVVQQLVVLVALVVLA